MDQSSRLLRSPHLLDLQEGPARDLLLAGTVAVLWGSARQKEVLDLALHAAGHRVRTYLLGPADLGSALSERARLKGHSRRLLCRRGVSSAIDLLLIDRGRTGLLGLPGPVGERPLFVPLTSAQAGAAFQWFAHLFWRGATEEGWAEGPSYRFRRCPDSLFEAAPPPAGAPLWMSRGVWPVPAGQKEQGPELLFASAEADVVLWGTRIEVRPRAPGTWCALVDLDPSQVQAL